MKNCNIPKIIHQIWIGCKVPEIISLYMNDWKKMNGWDYKLWSDKDLHRENFPKTWYLIEQILRHERPVYAMISDLMRLEILYKHGGVYLDTTFEKVKNLTPLLDKPGYEFVMSNEVSDPDLELPFISNSFIASVPGYIVIKRLLSKAKLSHVDVLNAANIETGPYYVRTGIKNSREVTLIPTCFIYPYDIESIWNRGTSKCVSNYRRPGFVRYKFFNKTYYVKYPCISEYPKSYMIKQWNIGGTWIRT